MYIFYGFWPYVIDELNCYFIFGLIELRFAK